MNLLLQILAILRALQWSHQTAHWKVRGESSYQDHLLFQKLYQAVGEEIDTLAEKIVGVYGPGALTNLSVLSDTHRFIAEHARTGAGDSSYQCALQMEEHLQRALKLAYDELKASGEMSLGLDDFLMATANAHETALYLLRQRNRPKAASAKTAAYGDEGRTAADRLAAIQQPKGYKPVYEGNAMAVPLTWGTTGKMVPYDVAKYMAPLFDAAKGGVAYVLDQNKVFTAAGLAAVEKALEQRIADDYGEQYAMDSEYFQGNDTPNAEIALTISGEQADMARKVKVKITPITSPTSGKAGLKVVFSPTREQIDLRPKMAGKVASALRPGTELLKNEQYDLLNPGDRILVNGRPKTVLNFAPVTNTLVYVDEGKSTKRSLDVSLAVAWEPGETPEILVKWVGPGEPPARSKSPRRRFTPPVYD